MKSNGDSTPSSSLFGSVVNLLKNCVGASVFSLSAKVVTVKQMAANATTNSIPITEAVLLIFSLALWAVYNFVLLGEVCRLTGESTYSGCWKTAVSKSTEHVVQSILSIAPFISCLGSTIVLIDIFSTLLKAVGTPDLVFENRSLISFTVCFIILFPLCCIEDLSTLSGSSLIGLICHVTAMSILFVRMRDGSYLEGGKYFESKLPGTPQVNATLTHSSHTLVAPHLTRYLRNAVTVSNSVLSFDEQSSASDNTKPESMTSTDMLQRIRIGTLNSNLFNWVIVASIISFGFVVHYNAPRFYASLENNTRSRFIFMAFSAYVLAAAIYSITAWLGIETFGVNCAPYILNGFAADDQLGWVARAAVAISVLTSTPLAFMSVRNWCVSVAWSGSTKVRPKQTRRIAFILIFLLAILAGVIRDISTVGSISGALLGSTMMFVLPPVMYVYALQQRSRQSGSKTDEVSAVCIFCNSILCIAGVILAVAGVYNSLYAALLMDTVS